MDNEMICVKKFPLKFYDEKKKFNNGRQVVMMPKDSKILDVETNKEIHSVVASKIEIWVDCLVDTEAELEPRVFFIACHNFEIPSKKENIVKIGKFAVWFGYRTEMLHFYVFELLKHKKLSKPSGNLANENIQDGSRADGSLKDGSRSDGSLPDGQTSSNEQSRPNRNSEVRNRHTEATGVGERNRPNGTNLQEQREELEEANRSFIQDVTN